VKEKAALRHERLRLEFRQERLERRYRRILKVYPAGHRRVHADEMIGVLIEAAGDSQYHGTVADTVNLLIGGLRIRGRVIAARLRHPRRRDAFTAVGTVILLALVLVTPGLMQLAIILAVIAAVALRRAIRRRPDLSGRSPQADGCLRE
jgi:hypothetical protein